MSDTENSFEQQRKSTKSSRKQSKNSQGSRNTNNKESSIGADGNVPVIKRECSRFLTKFERARIIGERAIEIENGAQVNIEIDDEITDPLKIAELELKQGKINYKIRRYLPNGNYEDWNVNELIFD